MASEFDDFLLAKPKGGQQGTTPATGQTAQTTAAVMPAAPAAPTPLQAMMDPTLVPAGQAPPAPLGVPLLGSIGAGLVQGQRNIAQSLTNLGNYVDARVPAAAWLDRQMGYPEQSALPAQSAAYQQQYGSSIPAQAAELGSGLLTAGRFTRPFEAIAAPLQGVPIAGNLLAPAARGAIAGGGTNLLMSPNQDPGTTLATGAVGGGIIGGGLGALGGLAGGASGSQAQAIADRLGIDLSFGQKAGGLAGRVEDASSIVPFSGAGKFAEQQTGQIAQAIAREAGISGPVRQLDTNMLNQAEGRIGNNIENAAGRITVPGDQPLLGRLAQIETNANIAGSDTQQARVTANLGNQILNIMGNYGGNMPGPEFQQFIARGGPLDAALSSSVPEVRTAAQGIKSALLDAGSRSSTASQDALDDLNSARYQWKVIQSVRPAIDRTTDAFSFPGLAQGIRNNFDMTQTGPGANMQDLARLISGPLRSLPSSGTAERAQMYRMLGIGGAPGIGGGALWALGHPQAAELAAIGTGAPLAGTALIGRAMRFGPGLGSAPWGAYQQLTNPLLPRTLGPYVGNQLVGP